MGEGADSLKAKGQGQTHPPAAPGCGSDSGARGCSAEKQARARGKGPFWDHASTHETDEVDTFNYPRSFARRGKPPIKGSDAEKLWMAITKGFLQEIDPFLESRTRTEAEAGTTHESMCCDNRCLKYHIYMNEPKHFWAGLGRPTTTCMPELAGPRVELPLEIPTSRSLCR